MDTVDAFHANRSRLAENHPVVSLILLLTLVFTGALVFGVFSIVIASAVVSNGDVTAISRLIADGTANATVIKIIQAGTSLGMFVVPALLIAVVEKRRTRYLDFNSPVNPMLWLMIVAIMFFSAPLMDQSIKLNERMHLPEAFSGIEAWMKAKEAELKKLTELLLSDTTYSGLLINLLVIAVIPAIGEEFLFRGCVQNIVTRWFSNPHVGVWVTAIVFSAIHLQFYGFLPRMLLGALFGYLLVWGKNIWLPVLAHFLNNATATVSAFYLQRQGRSLDELDFGEQVPTYLYFVSFVLTGVLLYQFYKTSLEMRRIKKRQKLA